MRGVTAMACLAVLPAASVDAEITPTPGPIDSRIRTAAYSADQVYRIQGFVGYDIGLEFEKDETFKRVNGGYLRAIIYSAQENTFTFKPRVRTTRTNLTVTTTKRRYYIEYSASDKQPDVALGNVVYVVRFIYPPKSPEDMSPQEKVDANLAKAADSRARNLDYWFCGDPVLKPIGAFDDGVQTRLSFAPNSELPAVFLRNDDGSESLLNFTVVGGDIVLHRLARRIILRRGSLTACIVNKSFNGSGDRLESGTLSSEVERASRTQRP